MDISQLILSQPAYVLWLAGGFFLLLVSATAGGEPIVAALGVAAIITAIASLTIASSTGQLIIWVILSVALAVVLRGLGLRHQRTSKAVTEAMVAETIPKGGVGVVSYEGARWQARCQVSDIEIPRGKSTYVVGRQGLTLIVLPAFDENEFSDV